ncbi:MAG: hypothetical protein DRP55_10400 [Spirochaetes bacterium]|nr:hypothetical protein [Thermoplasmata archaeon]RKX95351.1 MAG: hypothetical protein DRP55_10400 [Spirochaetota bacterium]HDD57253.1 hypothetical protein [Thermoplasmatales archaeon]HEC86988.1 hypothetical protein [Thermoplasmatales archaeon]
MKAKQGMQLVEGSKYRIFSVGTKESVMKTEGIFKGYVTLGVDEVGLCIEYQKGRKKNLRIIPLPVILAIDVVSKVTGNVERKDDENIHYYG